LLSQNSHDRHRNTVFLNFQSSIKGQLHQKLQSLKSNEHIKILSIDTNLYNLTEDGTWTDKFFEETILKQIKDLFTTNDKPVSLIINGLEKAISFMQDKARIFKFISLLKSKEIKNLRSVNLFLLKDQLDISIYTYIASVCNNEVVIKLDDDINVRNFEVDYFFKEPSGFSESYIFEVQLDFVKETVILEEAKENKEIIQETNPDKLVEGGTFSMGLTDQQRKMKDQVLLPHMELIKHYEDDDEEEQEEILGVDDEQDEDEDVDV